MIVNVLNKSYGVRIAVEPNPGTDKVLNLFLKKSALPLCQSLTFSTTVENQKALLFKLYENNKAETIVDLLDCVCIDEVKIPLPGLPKGVAIKVDFFFDNEGFNIQASLCMQLKAYYTFHGITTDSKPSTEIKDFYPPSVNRDEQKLKSNTGRIFGISFGTTYSCIYYVDEYGRPAVITNYDNKPLTPSVVYFESDGRVAVGEVAKVRLDTDPQFVCSDVKRQMGNRDWFFEAYGVRYDAETISSMILRKMTQDASVKLGEEVKKVVISCPAYFGISERKETENACVIAGLDVVSIVNETTAAAIAYGLNIDKPETVLVYDLGGGTFDVAIIQVDSGKSIRVVVSDGDYNLGGKNWDEEIKRYVISEFSTRTGKGEDSLYGDAELMGDLELRVEKAKKDLSNSEKSFIKVSFNGISVKIELTKEKFEELTAYLLNKTIHLTHQLLHDAKRKEVDDFDKIILVGGATRMPQVRERLIKEFPDKTIELLDPDEAIAKGAALYGMFLQENLIKMKQYEL